MSGALSSSGATVLRAGGAFARRASALAAKGRTSAPLPRTIRRRSDEGMGEGQGAGASFAAEARRTPRLSSRLAAQPARMEREAARDRAVRPARLATAVALRLEGFEQR